MKATRRFLAAIIITAIFTFSYNATVFAAEQAPADTKSGTDITVTSDNTNIEDQDASIDGTGVEQEPVLEDGQAMDDPEQSDNNGSDSDIEDPVITDNPEDAEGDASDEDTQDDSESDTEDQNETEPVVQEPTYSQKDLRLLACLVYTESGNQSYQGMLAVANVVLNRVKSNIYWHVNTVEEVIYDRKWAVQFSVIIKNSKTGLSPMDKALKCYDTGKFTGPNPAAEKAAMDKAIKAAKDALCGKNNIGNYLCFQNKRAVKSIKKKYSDYKIIGDHIFYRTK